MIKDPASASILKTGPGTKIRDLGRIGFAEYGIAQAGPLDQSAYLWVNHLLRNHQNEAVLEITQPGFSIRFDAPTLICLAGAKAQVFLNGKEAGSSGLIPILEGSKLEIGNFELGSILYLGIKWGFQIPSWHGSRSYSTGISDQDFVKKGDSIPYFTNHETTTIHTFSQANWDYKYLSESAIRVYAGPEFSQLPKREKEKIIGREFTISTLKNSMAIQLEEPFPNQLSEIYTAPVYPGTIQLTLGGKIICLLSDAQVTGGYPRILQIHEDDIRILAQKRSGNRIKFKLLK
ncbi:5-oxoprolinase subunit C family protein [Algoriphagus formosus]|uniref:Biotin-dependent carboxyltransferase n=1 Tax=Algoriphagus formosus TaxID=2007308 RepID=A0A4R5US30_9BACT|nr:biotin-dependent carboxyltransferase family protein [Algoriphagus aquimaris]TDK41908.1 biotin-dependent carboxyltransferase [Algoriphagus aquimaris]